MLIAFIVGLKFEVQREWNDEGIFIIYSVLVLHLYPWLRMVIRSSRLVGYQRDFPPWNLVRRAKYQRCGEFVGHFCVGIGFPVYSIWDMAYFSFMSLGPWSWMYSSIFSSRRPRMCLLKRWCECGHNTGLGAKWIWIIWICCPIIWMPSKKCVS